MTTSLRSCRRSKTHHRVVVESQLRRDSQQETAHCIQCSRQSPMHRARWSHSAQEEWISSPDTEEYVRQSSRLVHQMQSRPRVRKMKRRNRVSSKSSSVANTTLLLVSFPTTAFSRGGAAAAAAPRPLNTAELLFTEANLAELRCTTASTAAVVTNNKRTPTLTKNTTNASIRTHHIPHTSVSLSLIHTYILGASVYQYLLLLVP